MNSVNKEEQLVKVSEYRDKLKKSPVLRSLFLELTLNCNEHCLHCGSRCGDVVSNEMSKDIYFEFLDKIKRDFEVLPMLCITGGEPLLRKDLFEIMSYANSLGFKWGMTTNGTLITPEIAKKLKDTGMRTVSVSLDGLRQTHDSFRNSTGGFVKTLNGIRYLLDQDFDSVQVTTVVTKKNICDLNEMFDLVSSLDVNSWRVVNLEPIGRALELSDYMLDKNDYRCLFDFIKQKRLEGFPVTYGCSHYLGLNYERVVRDCYFMCNAGIYTASIMCNGDIGACLDIERRPETIQGNILKDDFTRVWCDKFDIFRKSLAELNPQCRECSSRQFCEGGSYHSWNYNTNEPMVCFKDVL